MLYIVNMTNENLDALAKLATIGELISGVTHEVNNALNFITGTIPQLGRSLEALDTICKEYDSCKLDPEDQDRIDLVKEEIDYDTIFAGLQKKLERYSHGAGRVQKIMKNLRSFSGSYDDTISVDINQGLESTIDLISYDVKDRIDIIRDFGEIPLIQGKPGQLNQVFMNLLINASHAIENRGEINVKTYTQDNNVCISVSDSGHGIPEQLLPFIFEPFYTTKTNGQGTGLGLSVSKKIVEQHNGTIQVDTKENEGTTFIISLQTE